MNERDKELANQITWYADVTLTELSRYANLIRADEREACAQECEGWTLLPGGYQVTLEEAKQTLVATIAKRIRARGDV
jgi:hypothetical protein